MTAAKEQQRVFLWAGVGDPSAIPGRLEVTNCAVCTALVLVAVLDAHLAWHAKPIGGVQ